MDTPIASTGKDYLSRLHAELLIEIISLLPLKCFLDLKHTSSFFKHFLQVHGAAICNKAIRSIHNDDAKLLLTTSKLGWLVAGDEVLQRQHAFYSTYSNYHPIGFHVGDRPYYDGFFGKRGGRNLLLNLAEPGPQFLYFLEQKMLWICDSKHITPGEFGHEYGFHISITAFQTFMAKVHGSAHWVERVDRSSFERFSFPRELIWYYKVEKK